jgi:hypothetical protein
MGEDTTRDRKVQQVTTADTVDSISTLPACGCVTRRFVGSDAVLGALVIGRWKSPRNPDATLEPWWRRLHRSRAGLERI